MNQFRRVAVALKCRIFPGSFSGERVVLIPLPNGATHKGLAPTAYCWKQDSKPLEIGDPAPGGSIDGIVAARLLGKTDAGDMVVTIPDGDVINVSKDIVVPRPEESTSYVPV